MEKQGIMQKQNFNQKEQIENFKNQFIEISDTLKTSNDRLTITNQEHRRLTIEWKLEE